MKNETNPWKAGGAIVLGALVALGGGAWLGGNAPAEPIDTSKFATADDIVALSQQISMATNQTVVPNNDILTALADLPQVKEDAWEAEAEIIATEEWEDNEYRDVYKAIKDIYGDLRDKDDIEYVREDESTDFDNMDEDDKDGKVTQYLKVKYEDENGDDKKVYLTVETTLDDGDLDDQEIFETE